MVQWCTHLWQWHACTHVHASRPQFAACTMNLLCPCSQEHSDSLEYYGGALKLPLVSHAGLHGCLSGHSKLSRCILWATGAGLWVCLPSGQIVSGANAGWPRHRRNWPRQSYLGSSLAAAAWYHDIPKYCQSTSKAYTSQPHVACGYRAHRCKLD